MEKFFIKNRVGKNISVILEKSDQQCGLAFVMPGLGNKKEEAHIRAMMDSFLAKRFTVLTFDVTNGVGESDGDYSQANFTGYYNDLFDLINWAKSQDWYKEPFYLAGHSMGGGCILWYTVHYPDKVLGLAPISTVIGGHQTLAKFGRDDLAATKVSEDGKEETKKLDWQQFKDDILKYDIVPEAHKLTMPVLMLVGEKDQGTPLDDQMKVYNNIISDKEIQVIAGAPHTFKETEHLDKLRVVFENWLDRINK
jgi:pimeloyl-ACP methyl ester carboxylesterase